MSTASRRYAIRKAENLRIERDYFRGISRQTFDQQGAGEKTGEVFSRQRRAVYLDPSAIWFILRAVPNELIPKNFHQILLAGESHCDSLFLLCNTPFTTRFCQEARDAHTFTGNTRAIIDI